MSEGREGVRGDIETFARGVEADGGEILDRYGSNHIPGDHVETLRVVYRLLDVDYDGFGSARGTSIGVAR